MADNTDNGWHTHRLELDDQTLREWDATVLASGPDGIVLDRSAFYPVVAVSRRTTAYCSGAACRPTSRAPVRRTSFT